MERDRLTRLLEEPGAVTREDLAGLRTLTERYPWFSTAQLLRTLGEQASGEVLFDGTLRTAAAHLPDRSVLFDAIHGKVTPPPVMRVVAPEPKVTEPASTEDRAPETVPNEAEAVEEEHAEIAAVVPSDPAEDDPLDQEIRRAALASGYALVLEHAPERAVPMEAASHPASPPPATQDAPEVARANPVEGPRAEPAAEDVLVTPTAKPAIASPEPTTSIPPGTKRRFTDWLDATVPGLVLSAGPATPVAVETGQPPVETTDRSLPDAPPVVQPKESPIDTATLIDRFIKRADPEPKPKTAFFTPQQAAKRSLDDTAGLVTETLARIHEKQGHLDKAIDAYRKLALKYPGKSAYFAALAKALEEQQNK